MTVAFDTRESPNHDARPAGVPVDILLLHYTGMRTAEGALERLCDRDAKVSCHWVVDEDGRIVRLVPEARRAWHAGVASWAGARDINARSVGIEIVNPGHEFGYRDFPDVQIASVIALCADILSRHPIPSHRVLGHSDVAPDRKTDPGERFPWRRLHAAGIGHWVEPAPVTSGPALGPSLGPGDAGAAVAALRHDLAAYGYGLAPGEAYDGETETVVAAFQRHFRPALVDGVADPSTRETLAKLRAALPNG
ncbi:N-acetylmuramoyl-L-alanine amidase [Microbaculum marinisediminis]|uniref:N-acetylmuramoyl-L-alanine amidase n=1 Tax=Microbaculum marinisediminis TaxID=2931392 RepID=A0AAW5R1Y4_9HYPH|nr:N-acetylmuramoyl-L-alanine amidase [Microbaculum sp. A6E488]MCT8972560.1 N-acetylmuramoyl-L-alanine amidase [Microbaculum sp. A6E488]